MKELMQTLVESKVNTKNIRKKIRQHLASVDVTEKLDQLSLDICKFLADNMNETFEEVLKLFSVEDLSEKVLLAVAYATTEPKPIQAIGAILGQEMCIKHPFEAIFAATELLNAGCESGLYDIHMRPNAIKISACFSLPDSLVKDIERAQYPMPMICKPRHIDGKDNLDTSHMTRVSHLVLGKGSQHKEQVSTDVINYFNSIPLKLDESILECEESSSKPLDKPDKVKQFEKMAKDSREVYDQMIVDGNRFWLTWKVDYRGRYYSQGYHINLQSTEYKKALISLANLEVMQ